jgi:hypothetical protein
VKVGWREAVLRATQNLVVTEPRPHVPRAPSPPKDDRGDPASTVVAAGNNVATLVENPMSEQE